MLVFPQLTTGAIGQFPVVRRRSWTAVNNQLTDGSAVVYSDGSPRTNSWELALRDLTDAEANAIETLFDGVEGRRSGFTFVDPTANLLANSEDLGNSCWTNGPMIQLTPGIDDPLGGTRAVRVINAAQTSQAVVQTLAAPAWFGYCFSVYARSIGGSSLSLTRSSSSATHTRLFQLGGGYARCVLSGALSATDPSLQFALELPAGASVDVFGIQAEAQPFPSAYKRTTSNSGVYSNARFDMDILDLIDDGPDQHRFDLKIVAKD
jgi:hypothetical protein